MKTFLKYKYNKHELSKLLYEKVQTYNWNSSLNIRKDATI